MEKQARASGLPGSEKVANLLTEAILLLQKGSDYEKAETLLKNAAKIEPDNPQANYYLGIIENEYRERPESAVKYFKKAYPHMKGRHDFHNNMGVAYGKILEHENALSEFEKAHKAAPDDIPTVTNMLTMAAISNNMQKIDEYFELFASIDPNNQQVKVMAAAKAREEKDFDKTESIIRELIADYPDELMYQCNLASLLGDKKNFAEGMDVLAKIMDEHPSFTQAFIGFGDLLIKQKNYTEAIPFYRVAIQIDPDSWQAYSQIGYVQHNYFEYDDAIESMKKAIEIHEKKIAAMEGSEQEIAHVRLNLASSLAFSGRAKEAEEQLKTIIKYRPDFTPAQWNLSLLYLATGRLKEGWKQFEWRWKMHGISDFLLHPRHFPSKLWDGSSLKGKSILLHGEQGLGDEIRMASLIPEILNMGAEVTLECERRLIDVFERSFKGIKAIPHKFNPDYEKTMSEFDFQCPLGTLPMYLRPTIEDFDKKQPKSFIIPDPDRVAFWKERLDKISDKPKIGIAWRSGKLDIKRSIYYATPDELGPIFSLKDDVEFINLQYGDDCHGELEEFKRLYGVVVHNWDDIDLKNDIDDAFALTANMDLMLGASTSPTDMAPAVGVETYIYLLNLDGYAYLGAKRSPWYTLQHLYPKGKWDDSWDKSTIKIAEDIRKKLNL